MKKCSMKAYRFYASNGDYLGRFTYTRVDIDRLFDGARVTRDRVYLS